jgi:hypothetical protein
MIRYAHIVVSLVIALLGLALLTMSLLANGTVVLSTHVIAGVCFIIYGAVRFYYLRGAR